MGRLLRRPIADIDSQDSRARGIRCAVVPCKHKCHWRTPIPPYPVVSTDLVGWISWTGCGERLGVHLALPQGSLVGWAKAPLGTFVVDAELSGAVPIMDTLMGTSLRSFAHPTSCKGGI